jgi:hypothetical protein
LTGTATCGFIFGGSREFSDDTKEGGCTTTVHADEPGETNGNNETDDNELPILEEGKQNKYQLIIKSKQSNK